MKNLKIYKLVVFLVIIYSSPAFAKWDKQSLLNEARVLMKYDGAVAEPEMVPKTRRQLEDMFCNNKGCVVSAIYTKGVIYYDKQLDTKNIIDRSILVHEMVHHIQRAKWGNTYTCSMWMKKEKQAYRLQILYLHKKGYKTRYIEEVAASLKCPI